MQPSPRWLLKSMWEKKKIDVTSDSAVVVDNPFVDIDQHWAKADILKTCHAGLFRGVTVDRFAPEGTMDRAMCVTALYRLAGCPDVESAKTVFTDVKEGRYYTDAVAWAVKLGVTNGMSDTSFAPHRAISRQEMVTMLYRYAKAQGQEVAGADDLSAYGDAASVSGWAKDAVAWAVATGILNGYPGNHLLPGGEATRGQAAAILFKKNKHKTQKPPFSLFLVLCNPCLQRWFQAPSQRQMGRERKRLLLWQKN